MVFLTATLLSTPDNAPRNTSPSCGAHGASRCLATLGSRGLGSGCWQGYAGMPGILSQHKLLFSGFLSPALCQ